MLNFPLFPGLGQPATAPAPADVPPDRLLTPVQIGGLTLPNRSMMAAMSTGFASRRGLPSPRLTAYYAARAAGGTGLIIVESALVTPVTTALPRLRLDTDDVVPHYRRLARAIHGSGARAAIQLHQPPVHDLRALHTREIAALAGAFGAAARRAREAGFDAVEVQASHRSLLAHLLSAATNRRRDRYGRTFEGHVRAAVEVIGAIRVAAGDDFPILVKYSADEYRPNGVTPELAQQIGRALVAAGASALEIIAGSSASEAPIRLSAGVGEATQADLAAAVKAAVGVPVIAAGRILSSETAEQVLRERKGDAVALGRALLADPAWVAKVRAGIDLEVIPCIGCMACFTPAPDGATGCPVNAEAGQEYLPPLSQTSSPRRVVVLGANLAGLEFARIAASRGHRVEIVTGDLPLGGLLGLRAGVPGNAEFGRAFLYFGERLNELGVGIVDEAAGGSDLTVDCRPGAEVRPEWAHGKGVLLAGELLGRDLHQLYGIGRRVAVVGPGALAAEVALFLSGWGRRPWVIVPGSQDDPFPDVHPMHAARLLERMEGYKVPLVTEAAALEWRYDEDRKSTLRVFQRGKETVLQPFHSAVAAAGWPASRVPSSRFKVQSAGGVENRGAFARWPAALLGRLTAGVRGSTIMLGDTPYAEPLRDLVAQAHLLARRI